MIAPDQPLPLRVLAPRPEATPTAGSRPKAGNRTAGRAPAATAGRRTRCSRSPASRTSWAAAALPSGHGRNWKAPRPGTARSPRWPSATRRRGNRRSRTPPGRPAACPRTAPPSPGPPAPAPPDTTPAGGGCGGTTRPPPRWQPRSPRGRRSRARGGAGRRGWNPPARKARPTPATTPTDPPVPGRRWRSPTPPCRSPARTATTGGRSAQARPAGRWRGNESPSPPGPPAPCPCPEASARDTAPNQGPGACGPDDNSGGSTPTTTTRNRRGSRSRRGPETSVPRGGLKPTERFPWALLARARRIQHVGTTATPLRPPGPG